MPLILRGMMPAPGQVDRRYYLIRVQVQRRRVCLSSGVLNRPLALKKEQMVVNALRSDLTISQEDLVALVRGKHSLVCRVPVLPSRADLAFVPMTLKQACDQALRDRLPWGRGKRGWADSLSRVFTNLVRGRG
jgi:hypothetical protein